MQNLTPDQLAQLGEYQQQMMQQMVQQQQLQQALAQGGMDGLGGALGGARLVPASSLPPEM